MASTKALKALYGSKLGKILPVLLIAGMVATASASIFVQYYAVGTVTAQTNSVQLISSPDDNGGSCGTNTPCFTATIAGAGDYASIAMNLGVESTQTPQPKTVFTDVLEINNTGTTSRTVTTTLTSATETGSFYGSLTIYYCTAATSNPVGDGNCITNGAITSDVSSPTPIAISQTLAANGGLAYIAIVGWAAGTSTSLSFNLQFQWA
jgi:hypothetical protein